MSGSATVTHISTNPLSTSGLENSQEITFLQLDHNAQELNLDQLCGREAILPTNRTNPWGYLLTTSSLLLQWNEFYKQTAKQGIEKRKKWIDRQDLTSFVNVGRTSPKMLFTPGMFVANGVINFYGWKSTFTVLTAAAGAGIALRKKPMIKKSRSI